MSEEKQFFPGISIVMPTLNCRYLIESHADEIRDLCSSVGEIVIVDSYSDDGTVDFLKTVLAGLPFQVIQRPRGLYESWNAGIKECRGRWIHLSTAGDLLGSAELGYLEEVAGKTGADVVMGIPRFVNTGGVRIEDPPWPIVELFERRKDEDVIEMSGLDLLAFSLACCRVDRRKQSWLGSSASNLYSASCLKKYPFPSSVGSSGDALWGLRHADKVSAVFCRRRSGRFVVHEKPAGGPAPRKKKVSLLYTDAWIESAEHLVAALDEKGVGMEVTELFKAMLKDQVTLSRVLKRRRRSATRKFLRQTRRLISRFFVRS